MGHRRASGSSLFRLSECPSGAATDSLGWTLASEWMKVIFFNPSMKCPKLLAFLWLPMMVVLGVRGRERNVSKRRERGWSERRKGGQVAPEVGAPGPSPRCCDGQLAEGPPHPESSRGLSFLWLQSLSGCGGPSGHWRPPSARDRPTPVPAQPRASFPARGSVTGSPAQCRKPLRTPGFGHPRLLAGGLGGGASLRPARQRPGH